MPRSRRTKVARKLRAVKVKAPLPRITEPYAPLHPYIAPLSVEEEEPARILHNRKVKRLEKCYHKVVAANLSILDDRTREEANWPVYIAHDNALEDYENQYGKFIPNLENAAWFARKAPRVADLMVLRNIAGNMYRHNHPAMVAYFDAENTFREDFGHQFVCPDGLDDHFKRMRSHEHTAHALTYVGATLLEKLLSEPLVVNVLNPYLLDDPDHTRFDDLFSVEDFACWQRLPITASWQTFSFPMLQGGDPDAPGYQEERLHRYYQAVWVEEVLEEVERHHREDYDDSHKLFDWGIAEGKCPTVPWYPGLPKPIGVECAPQDLFGGRPLGLLYDLAYQFCDSSRDCTGLMTDELCERGWREQMPTFTTYRAQDCDDQFGYQPHDCNGLTTGEFCERGWHDGV
ncbi:hypothetical protein DFH09DRAFT_1067430 [Mycena vulgaris]|nr:hypothetical protein DFH09DRAFT_1067430 [Mycena vulgaris]